MKTKVGVIFGCPSVEHEVAIISAQQAIHGLNREKYEVVPIYITKDGQWYMGDALLDIENFKNIKSLLSKCKKVLFSPNNSDGNIFPYPQGMFSKGALAKIDVFFPVMHGAQGEDGCLQGLLEMTGLPYVGPNTLSAALGMDKIAQKALCQMGAIPVLDCFWFYSSHWSLEEESIIAGIEEKFPYPLIVKPADTGSSIGIKKAQNREELRDAVDLAYRFSQKVLVEPAIMNLQEINIAVLGDEHDVLLSCLEEPVSQDEILSYKDKYLQGGNKGMSGLKRRIPAEIPGELEEEIKAIAKKAFAALFASGVWRMDFMVDRDNGKVYLNEVNTIPGSLSFYLWAPVGLPFPDLLDRLIQIALKRKQDKGRMVRSYETNILAQGGFKGKK